MSEIQRKLEDVQVKIKSLDAGSLQYTMYKDVERELMSAMTANVKLHVDIGPTCEGCQ